jgi:hypothetical protein
MREFTCKNEMAGQAIRIGSFGAGAGARRGEERRGEGKEGRRRRAGEMDGVDPRLVGAVLERAAVCMR